MRAYLGRVMSMAGNTTVERYLLSLLRYMRLVVWRVSRRLMGNNTARYLEASIMSSFHYNTHSSRY